MSDLIPVGTEVEVFDGYEWVTGLVVVEHRSSGASYLVGFPGGSTFTARKGDVLAVTPAPAPAGPWVPATPTRGEHATFRAARREWIEGDREDPGTLRQYLARVRVQEWL